MTDPVPYSIAEARNQLTRLLRQVERGRTVGLTRRGKLVAVLVSEPDYRRLASEGRGLRRALADFLRARPRSGVLTARQAATLRDRGPGREVAL